MKEPSPEKSRSGKGVVILAFIAFISLGLPDGLLGVAWPSMRESFSRSLDSLGMLLVASMAGYLLSSFYSGLVTSRLGVGWLLSLSCLATGASLLGYTLAPHWWMMIPLAVVAGLGAGAIDGGINTYVASNFGEHLMQWVHASYGIGITMGPVIMTTGLSYFSSWRPGYIVVGGLQIALAASFALTVSMWQTGKSGEEKKQVLSDYKTPMMETLRQPDVWISILLFFIYAGIEATIGSWAYTLLTESRGISSEIAGFFVGSYWATFTVGRILAGIFTRRFRMHSLIRGSLAGAFAGALLLIWSPFKAMSLIGVVIIGFAIAPIFPGMVSLTTRRVGARFAANTIGMQISAAGLGVAAIPGLTGVLAQRTSLEVIPALVLLWIISLFILYSLSIRREKTPE
ncbi:MAG: MFS transporter [Ignavibacteria bacterium]|jgi:fucose permease|nr:MFS transporter [Ignavibacteria bacterium]MCU7500729.1 MFS transporter [Ignavibacteria bacterium]MCU7514559.1 MFS transporter [Ignavibacteria bacterium]MCU7520870.1 MFS transporter [Ignavibacteria bacterium]MCU7526455.1 MFS transporter [Ignavibacteria bacterium]